MPVKTLDEYLKQTTPKQTATNPKYRIIEFYKETRFQETPIGKIPEQWEVTSLTKVATIIMGQSPPSETYNREGIGLPFLQGKAEFGRIFPKPRLYTSKPIRIAEEGDILISVRAPVGDVNIAPFRLCIGRGLAAIRFDKNRASTLFYFYYFNYIKPRLENLGKGSTFKAITKGDLEVIALPYPPLEEQWGIAEVLYSIDEAIEATEKLIERLKRLKRGLMQELLTRGIGHREYKQTPIGKIPKEWKIVKIENIAKVVKTGPFGSQLRKSELTRKGIKVYTQENVLKRDFSIGNLYISEKKFNQLKNFEVKPNDVLLTIRGTVGKAAVVPYHVERGIIHTNLAIIRVDDTKILPRYLELIINEADIVARQVKASHSSTTLPALYAGTIKRLKIPLPSLEEQKKIVDIISSVNKWIELERKRKEKLERLKRGLMELLLTGRVRVRVERLDSEEDLPGSGGGAGS